MTGLVLDDVAITLDGRPLVGPLSIEIAPGEVVTVMGPSGSGKSTLLAYVGGFLPKAFAARGRVAVDGTEIGALPPEKRAVGILFQDDLLFPHLSVGGNLAFGLRGSVREAARRRALVEEALAQANLAGFADRDPATLSGGQRARVALMRTLLAEPRALLLDEPFGKLDATLRHDVRAFVFARARDRGLPTLLVTHDAEDARAAGGRVIEVGVDPGQDAPRS
ncbi:ATP-binding cassette domain-containing protein [Salinarimonas rosea]|uniref:ATP-binding cassette domain-containing protein n=1 Tax=Salinarimonas rosea TaxID=552063 RepID=UPI0004224EDA|nr:ATP-binding cassette domain-containing protein [Salinarimonas rosea]